MRRTIVLILLTLAVIANSDVKLKGKVRKRNTVITNKSVPNCYYNDSLYVNKNLFSTVSASKYIFTGKISNVRRLKKGLKFHKERYDVFKIYVRRVLSGDMGELSKIINFETRTVNSSNKAYVFAERAISRTCLEVPQVGWLALMFSDGRVSSSLNLVTDPLPLNAEYVKKVKAFIKGMFVWL